MLPACTGLANCTIKQHSYLTVAQGQNAFTITRASVAGKITFPHDSVLFLLGNIDKGGGRQTLCLPLLLRWGEKRVEKNKKKTGAEGQKPHRVGPAVMLTFLPPAAATTRNKKWKHPLPIPPHRIHCEGTRNCPPVLRSFPVKKSKKTNYKLKHSFPHRTSPPIL